MSARNGEQSADCGHWSWREVNVAAFKDARLGRRFGDLLRRLSEGMGGSIPFACQDWTNTKAAYRFFSNPRVEESEILNGHFASTSVRDDESDGTHFDFAGHHGVHLPAPRPAPGRLHQERE
jgi:hypothetical protein